MMEKIEFCNLEFTIKDDKVLLTRYADHECRQDFGFVEVQVSGENKDTHLGAKMAYSSEGVRLKYVSHAISDGYAEIVQASELVEVKTVFESLGCRSAVRVYTEVKNLSGETITLEEVSSFVLGGFGALGIDGARDTYFTRFTQSHHAECQPRRASFEELGLFRANRESQKRIACANVGSWSTKEELPQGIIEDAVSGQCIMFQIESNSSWYYEIADRSEQYYLYLGGANLAFGGWSKPLSEGEVYKTPTVALAFATSVGGVIGAMTEYRRAIAGRSIPDESLPTIFNEYMHLSWDSPTEENTRRVAPVAASLGVEYYVIDCGWHNEEDGDKVYPYIGQWRESRARFPNGVRKTTDFIRSLGMKPGLWIEPEVIGLLCRDMLEYYDDDCFMQRNGKRLTVMGRHFLDFRARKVRDYMTETIRRMVEDYGAEYIKLDYNQDLGVGTDYLAFCAGEGLEVCAAAYLSWIDEVRGRFPDVLFETCSSGGMRMDYETLSHFSIVSTSDQTDYLKYPYIAGNILAGVLPEQAAVWSYPVGCGEVGKPLTCDEAWVGENITAERIAMNMINSFLGRMHLASHIELLADWQRSLVEEGVAYYKSLSKVKRRALPYFPNGFCRFGDEYVVAGFETEDVIYLAVWALKTDTARVNINTDRSRVKIAYPHSSEAQLSFDGGLSVSFPDKEQAVFLEIRK